jgi:phosphoribosylformylglycinamidine (FGAM) synthase-like amidotransferase family enzyme
MTRYLICGGRDFRDYELMEKALRALILHPADAVIIHGAARGADTLAARWGQCNGSQVIACPADWDAHPKAAGPIRNSQMLTEHKPDVVIAFPGGRGTADMVRKARSAGVVTVVVTGEGGDWFGHTTGGAHG